MLIFTIKIIFYKIICPFWYGFFCFFCKINLRQVLFIETRNNHVSNNFAQFIKWIKNEDYFLIKIIYKGLEKSSYFKCLLWQLSMLKAAATAKYIFIYESVPAFSAIHLRKETVLVQTWHGCGAFKRFGYSCIDSIFGFSKEELKIFPQYKNYSYITVSSAAVIPAFQEAMNLFAQPEKFLLGVSRTDVYFDKKFIETAARKIHQKVPQIRERKIILYAPTYRGHTKKAEAPQMPDFELFRQKGLDKHYVVLIKQHFVISGRPRIKPQFSSFVYDVTEELSIDELLCVSDICVSDYSSLIFEYSLFERPMIFYAYDLDEYYDWRGFFDDYRTFLPGPIAYTAEELTDYIGSQGTWFDKKKAEAFKKKYMSACDGQATQRLCNVIFNLD